MRDFAVTEPVYLLPLTPMSIAAYHLLKKQGIAVAGFCDNNPRYAGAHYQGVPCLRPKEAAQKDPNAVFILGAHHGRTRTALLQEIESLAPHVISLEQILEKGDIDSILPDIEENEACKLLAVRSVRDFAEIYQSLYIPPKTGFKKIVNSICLYSYRNMRQDFDDLALPEYFIRSIIIKSEKKGDWIDIVRYIAQSGKNIGIIQIQKEPLSDTPLQVPTDKIPMPLYITSRQRGILSRKSTDPGIPIEIWADDLYPTAFDERETIFIHIPKNSGSALRNAFHLRSPELPHATARYFRHIDSDKFHRYFSFAIARNPWNRLLSCYTYCRENFLQDGIIDAFRRLCAHASFQEVVRALKEDTNRLLLRHEMIAPQYEWICDENGKIMVDYIGRFENLTESYAQIAKSMGIPFDGSIPHANASRHRPYQDYYDADTKAIVGELFKTDIELFGYTFD